jgi:uncharacterized ferredoxin-like protein
MGEEEKICGVCGKNPATANCDGCGMPLCDECTHKVKMQSGDVADQMVGFGISSGVSVTTLRPGMMVKKLCEKCYKELDVLM